MKKKQDRKADKEANLDMQKLRKKLRASQIQSKKTKEMIENGGPKADEIIERIHTICKETEETLDKDYEIRVRLEEVDGVLTPVQYPVKKQNLKELALREQHNDFIKSPEKIREERQRINEEHNSRMEQALLKKKELEEIRRQAIIRTFEEHSENYRKEMKEREIEMRKMLEIKSKVMGYLNCEILVKFLHDVATNHLKQKREVFLFNMKARLIQWTFRKYRVLTSRSLLMSRSREFSICSQLERS